MGAAIEKPHDMSDLPPGTVRLKDVTNSRTILVPHPSPDPNQPLNWSMKRKALQMGILCVYTTLTFSILTVLPPLWQDITNELGITTENLNYGYATAYGSLTVACVVFVPLSINFGRRPVYLATSLIMIASSVWMGCLRTTFDVLGSNFLSGIAGAVNEALFNMTICDLFFVHQRGTMTGIYLMVVILGTYLAPVAAGYIAAAQGWRWVFWYCIIFMGITFLVMLFALEETKFEPDMIFGQRVNTPVPAQTHHTEEKENGPALHQVSSAISTIVDSGVDHSIPKRSYSERHAFLTPTRNTTTSFWKRFVRQLYQPFYILVLFPAVMFSALQYAWSESMLSFLAVTQATLYPLPPYNFSAIGIGNMNIPPAIGAIIGSLFGGVFSDYLILGIAKRRGGIFEPEYRLWTFMVPGLAMVAGVLMYGLTIAEGMPWIINSIGAGLVGFALGGSGDIALTYVQDSYDGIIGPALTGVVFVRNGMATVMTFVIPIWANNLGFYNMFALLGGLAALIALTCVPLLIWGRHWRVKLADLYAEMAKQDHYS